MGRREDHSRRSKKHKRRKASKDNIDTKQNESSKQEVKPVDSSKKEEKLPDSDKTPKEVSSKTETATKSKLETKDAKVELPTTSVKNPSTASKTISLETSASNTPAKTEKNKQASTSSAPSSSTTTTPITTSSPQNVAKKSRKRRNSGTSSDEERWLTAIESGKLDDVDDELKKIKDPKLMTARQRAIYDRSQDKDSTSPGTELLMSLPNGYREKEKPQTAEEIQKAVLKSQKRKQQADERREKDKKKTMERLLKKQDSSKQRGAAARNKLLKPVVPMVRYNNTIDGGTISMPIGFEFPLVPRKSRGPPKQTLCGVKDCTNPKVYNCSKTKTPLCSIECYRKNLTLIH